MAQGSADMARPESGSSNRTPASGYAGDISPKEAWEILAQEKDAVLVDCRSQAEWSFVGLPDLTGVGKRPVLVEWQSFTPGTAETGFKPRMVANLTFAQDLERAGVPKDTSVIFICRSGGRSRSAAIAMTQQGWRRCYNLAGGFEGAHDATQHRGAAQGWKAEGLPWWQE
jgi:rhodanese-related sulfurtransferase